MLQSATQRAARHDASAVNPAAFIAVMRCFLPCIAAGLLSCSACSGFGPAATVVVTLPALPDHWRSAFPDMAFLIVFTDSSGDERQVAADVGGSHLTIDCLKQRNGAIVAYPIAARDVGRGQGERGFLRPAGGLYPLSLDTGADEPTLALTWEQGPLAVIMSRLSTAGKDVSLINAERLDAYLRKHPDPWALDLDEMAQRIVEGDFSVYDIDLLPCRDIRVKPGQGAWFLESPFSEVVQSTEDEGVDLSAVSLGHHALFSLDAGVWRIQVGAQETTSKKVR
jgi:hypothetical protein